MLTLFSDQTVIAVVGVVGVPRDCAPTVADHAEVEFEEFMAEPAGVARAAVLKEQVSNCNEFWRARRPSSVRETRPWGSY